MNGGAAIGLAASIFLLLFIPIAPVQWVAIFFITVTLLSKLYSVNIRRSLSVSRVEGTVKVFKFQEALIELSVVNRSFLPISYLSLIDDAGNLAPRDQNRASLSLRPRQRITFRYELKGYNRGVYPLGPVQIATSDPLGFFPWRTILPVTGSMVVYPSVYPLSIHSKDGNPSGNLRVWNPIYEDVTNYRSLREYVPGDDPRRINWKVSARIGSLQTMQYLPAISFPVLILLDLNLSHWSVRNRYQHTERAIEAAASLVQSATNLGQPVGLHVTGNLPGRPEDEPGTRSTTLSVSAGVPHSVAALELLARIAPTVLPQEEGPIAQFLGGGSRLPTGARLFYVGPALDSASRELLVRSVPPARTGLFYVDEGIRASDSMFDGVLTVRWVTPAGEKIVD